MESVFESKFLQVHEGQPELSREINEFFQRYEKDSDSGGTSFLSRAYAESFIFCGPESQQAVKREDFLMALPKMKGFYRSIGLTSTKLLSTQVKMLDDCHAIVKTECQMTFEPKGRDVVVETIFATSILSLQPDMKIVFQLDHQDLMKKVKERGLVSEGKR